MLVLASRPESGVRRVRAFTWRPPGSMAGAGQALVPLAVQRAVTRPARGPPESSRPRTDPCSVSPPSPADSEFLDDSAISLRVLVAQILQQAPSLADQHEQPPPRVMVLRVLLEVLREAVDALGEERDLDLRGPGITVVDAELLDQAALLLDRQRHGRPPFNR